MPCNWSTTASLLFRGSWTGFGATKSQVICHNVPRGRAFGARPPLHLPTPNDPRHRIVSRPRRPVHDCARAYGTAAAFASAPNVHAPSQPFLSSALASTTSQLSPAQVSRAAAQAVRLCIKEGGFGDALYVVNSACYSILGDPLQPRAKDGPPSQLRPIQFGCPVSPRLAAHAFLHGLLRGGYTRKAQIYAKLMIKAGIPIRTRTFETVITSTLSRPSTLFKVGPFARLIPKKRIDNTPATFKLPLQSGFVSDRCTRAALELLQTARTFGQQRTERMYRVLVETLLMQGEIIVASLLFVLLLQDWELRKLQEGVVQEANKDHITYDHLADAPPHPAKLLDTPYPDLRIMGKVLETVKQSFTGLSDNDEATSCVPYFQSLAIFAMLLDTGQLHTHRVAAIINALYKCPKTNARVWILRDGKMVQVEAYTYFHAVLKRLVDSLSGQDPLRPPQNMSRRSYNSLLTYSLRHRFSPAMASQVLQHMCVDRSPPMTPDIVTFNILLRSGTLLRKLSISDGVLSALRLGGEEVNLQNSPFGKPAPSSNDGHPLNTTIDDTPSPTPSEDIPHSDFKGAKERLSREELTMSKEIISPLMNVGGTLEPTVYTLSSFITHLTSIGRPDAIATVLFDILPELNVVVPDHPATNGSANIHSTIDHTHALRQAAMRGPYVYATMINALVKAGEIGLAERVFILAQQAAIASTLRNFAKDVQPWRLSVHAFTSLMQGYARLAIGNLPSFKRERRYVGTTLLVRDSRWEPKTKHYDAGYAQYMHAMLEEGPLRKRYTKRQTSRRNAILLYRSMMLGAHSLLERVIQHHVKWPTMFDNTRARTKRGITVWWWETKPDARFFNAALELFAAASRVERSKRRPSRFWHRRLQNAKRRFEQTGEVSADKWTPMLHKIVQAMVAHGFSVPVAYRHLLVGKWEVPMKAKRKRKMVIQAPYSFPPSRVHKIDWPYSLPTAKTRGLPVRKRGRRRTKDECTRKPVS